MSTTGIALEETKPRVGAAFFGAFVGAVIAIGIAVFATLDDVDGNLMWAVVVGAWAARRGVRRGATAYGAALGLGRSRSARRGPRDRRAGRLRCSYHSPHSHSSSCSPKDASLAA